MGMWNHLLLRCHWRKAAGRLHAFFNCGAHHFVAVVQREHELLEVPARILLAQPLSAPQHPNAE